MTVLRIPSAFPWQPYSKCTKYFVNELTVSNNLSLIHRVGYFLHLKYSAEINVTIDFSLICPARGYGAMCYGRVQSV